MLDSNLATNNSSLAVGIDNLASLADNVVDALAIIAIGYHKCCFRDNAIAYAGVKHAIERYSNAVAC